MKVNVGNKRPMIDTAVKAMQAMNPMAVERLLAVVAEIVIRLLGSDQRRCPGNSPRWKGPKG